MQLHDFYKLNTLIVHVTFVFWYLCCAYRCMYYSDFFVKEKHYQSWSKLRLMKLTMWYIPCCYSNRRTKDPLKHPILGFSHLLGMYQAKFMKHYLKHSYFLQWKSVMAKNISLFWPWLYRVFEKDCLHLGNRAF